MHWYINFFLITLGLTFNTTVGMKSEESCYPDRGIKKARITVEIKESNEGRFEKIEEYREVEFNRKGQPTLMRGSNGNEGEFKRVYEDGALKYIIAKQKRLPDFYDKNEEESLIKNASIVTDTALIVKHAMDGRPLMMKNPDGTTLTFEYKGCDTELQTIINPLGDTIQQHLLINKDGVLIESVWTPFMPIKTSRTSKYFDYQFDRRGHWSKRSYHYQDGPTIRESRKLKYY